jgi:hypothetical protein
LIAGADKAGNGIVPEWMVYAHEADHYLEGFSVSL